MTRLYHNQETFTRQMRMLETYAEENPRSAAHFLLAVEYLTTGYSDAAALRLQRVVSLRPDDELTGRLLRELQPAGPVAEPPDSARMGESGKLEGTWTARPREGAVVTLTIGPRGHIRWWISQGGKVRQYEGFGLSVDGILTLTEDPENSLSGRVNWRDPRHCTFKVLEGGPVDPGLSFAKSS